MKKITVPALLFALSLIPAFGVDFHLKLGGGISGLNLSGLNRVLTDWETEQILDAQSRPNWAFINGETGELRSTFDLAGELMLTIHPNLAFSLSSGVIHADLSAGETNLVIERALGQYNVIHPVKISGFPFVFSGYFQIPLWTKTHLYLRAGAGYMAARLVEQTGFKRVENAKYVIELNQNASGSGQIYLGGLGISYQISEGTAVFAESLYRNSRMKDFSNNTQNNGSAVLYSYQKYNSDLELWSAVFRFHENIPSGEGVRAVEKAEIDMSGFSINLGIMIHF